MINSAVSGVGAGPYGVLIQDSAVGTFAFNTVTGNPNGVQCRLQSQTITDSIVALITTKQVDKCAATRVYQGTAVDFVHPYVSPNPTFDLHLSDTANNAACCVDKGSAPAPSEPQVPTDFFGTARPKGAGYDLGFHELK
jgi:hypothetical protein